MLFRCYFYTISMVLFFSPALTLAQDDLDDILSGFGDSIQEVAPEETIEGDLTSGFENSMPLSTDQPSSPAGSLPPWLDLSGALSLGLSYNYAHEKPSQDRTDHRGFSRFCTQLDLDADVDLPNKWKAKLGGKVFYDSIYSLRGRTNYTNEVLRDYEDELELKEIYLQGSLLPSLDLKFGRQLVVWGKSDTIRVTDVLNPLDNREPGVVDVKDLRLPITMTKLDYYRGDWNASAIIGHEIRFNKEPVFGNDFFPGSVPSAPEDKPSFAWDNQEYGLALNGIFSGWDLSLLGAWFWDDQSHLENTSAGLRRQHSRISMLGASVNIAHGNWLIKSEAAYLDGLQYSIDVGEKNRLDLLAGGDYSGFSETVVSLEVVNRHILAFDDRLKAGPVYSPKNEFQSILRLNRDYLNDTLQITLLISTFGLTGDGGSFQRASATYHWSDDITIKGGVIVYHNGDKAMYRNIDDNDRIFAELRYTF